MTQETTYSTAFSAAGRACPFCGQTPATEPWHGGTPVQVRIYCPDTLIGDCPRPSITAETIEEALAIWNRREPAWPQTRDVILPRDPAGRDPDQVAEILGLAASPWHLASIATLLRASREVDVPRKAEAEKAAALHWLLGFAVRHGDGWHPAYIAARDRLKARVPAPAIPGEA